MKFWSQNQYNFLNFKFYSFLIPSFNSLIVNIYKFVINTLFKKMFGNTRKFKIKICENVIFSGFCVNFIQLFLFSLKKCYQEYHWLHFNDNSNIFMEIFEIQILKFLRKEIGNFRSLPVHDIPNTSESVHTNLILYL